MGASLSNLTEGANGSAMGPGLGDIPESCVACVFLYLTPPEICNLARLNRAFRGAASSDAVWESKLPPNYHDLLDLLPPERYQNLTKKDIFALLSRPVPFDDGNKEIWLDRVTGRLCMSISAKAMAITGIEDRRYWNWIPTEESRLHLGRFSKRLGRRVCNFEHTHGLDVKPVRFELSTSDGQQASYEYCLDATEQDDANGNHKRGCWVEYKVGDFVVSEPATEVRFSMKQIDCTHSKGGLCVDSVFIVPSDLKG
ncbi:F-box protein PP2-A15 isoform X2 [Malania oleifera]|uniref:F-box protein PP2-A15 isoform X2 n=1 Tax=Malania oleifera TaxID=397392 RepID=UPI0025AE7308|nr:F-box protein PP2-A15 isoform X2 [Malania oleifera]